MLGIGLDSFGALCGDSLSNVGVGTSRVVVGLARCPACGQRNGMLHAYARSLDPDRPHRCERCTGADATGDIGAGWFLEVA